MTTDKPKPQKRRVKARRTTGRSAGISQSAFAGYGHQQPTSPPANQQAEPEEQSATDNAAAESSKNETPDKGEKNSST